MNTMTKKKKKYWSITGFCDEELMNVAKINEIFVAFYTMPANFFHRRRLI